MLKPHQFCSKISHRESGNAVIIVLVVLVVAAVGALVYLSGDMGGKKGVESAAVASASSPESGSGGIKPGNPVVARVDNTDITRLDVFNYIETLPPNTRQLPMEQLFPAALEQVINARVVNNKTKDVNLDNDPEVQAQLEEARENITRAVYMQHQVEQRITEERILQLYESYKVQFPEAEEIKARHILVADEATAMEVIKKLEGGADFAALAREYSTDGTADSGGELGYFVQADVVAPFGAAAFATAPGSFTATPVQTDFGYHVIMVEDKRVRQPMGYEEAKPFLESQLRRIVLDEVMNEWREAAAIKRYNINGEEIKPEASE